MATDRVLCRAADRARGKNEDARSDEAGDQIADPTTTRRNTDKAEQPGGNRGPHDAKDDVHHKAHLAFHELLGEPASNTANDNGRNPTDRLTFHGVLLFQDGHASDSAIRDRRILTSNQSVESRAGHRQNEALTTV